MIQVDKVVIIWKVWLERVAKWRRLLVRVVGVVPGGGQLWDRHDREGPVTGVSVSVCLVRRREKSLRGLKPLPMF